MRDHVYRSRSTAFDRRDMQIQPYTGPQPSSDFTPEMTRGKPRSSSSSFRNWGFSDPEFQRRKRVASYKAYAVEGRVKGSFRHGFRWLKDKYTKVVYGGWW
uniref:Uncharacterized protein n=1 Tax=Kalanchoe fedtschenkoi TaxID=63787 RepID=A0A7N1A583_KALFE